MNDLSDELVFGQANDEGFHIFDGDPIWLCVICVSLFLNHV